MTQFQPSSPDLAGAFELSGYKAPIAAVNPALLKEGSTGADVVKLQYILKEIGRLIPGDKSGTFGQMTHLSVVQFQGQNLLEIDGKVGSQTWDALSKAYKKQKGKKSVITNFLNKITGDKEAKEAKEATFTPAPTAEDYLPTSTPFYKQAWFIPAAVGGSILLIGTIIIVAKG
jgi:hypothetical protein